MQKIFIGSDHAGFKLKEKLKKLLKTKKIKLIDLGTSSTESVDYPDIAKKLAKKVVKEKAKGILLCGTGIGMSITANKIKGIRAALVYNIKTAKLAKEHNNANIICIGARTQKEKKALQMIKAWLNARFQKGRHLRRIKKIEGFKCMKS
jgi:ribose 5-phosphate isomerase B